MKKRMECSKNTNKVPFSKKNVIYARFEAYVFSFILIGLILIDKDISAIASALLSLSWAGYKALQMFYIKMAEREHLEEIRQGRLREQLETFDIDSDIEELESVDIQTEIENSNFY